MCVQNKCQIQYKLSPSIFFIETVPIRVSSPRIFQDQKRSSSLIHGKAKCNSSIIPFKPRLNKHPWGKKGGIFFFATPLVISRTLRRQTRGPTHPVFSRERGRERKKQVSPEKKTGFPFHGKGREGGTIAVVAVVVDITCKAQYETKILDYALPQ